MNTSLNRVTLRGREYNHTRFTYNVPITVTEEHLGRAMTFDPTTPCGMKLAGDGDRIEGKLFAVEEFNGVNTATVTLAGYLELPYEPGVTVALGQTLVGAGNGYVKGVTHTDANTVVELIAPYGSDPNNYAIALFR